MADYVLNMGGSNMGNSFNTVDIFKATGNSIEYIINHGLTLSQARSGLVAASCGDYILAMGGSSMGMSFNTVDIFKATDSGIEAITDHGLALSETRNVFAAASAGNYILAMGGYGSNGYLDTIDVFKVTENGVEAVPDHGLALSVARSNLTAASCGNYILAIGGADDLGSRNTIDVFKVTENGVEAVPDHGLTLSHACNELAAASCGNYILAMGGFISANNYSNTVDVFKVTANGMEKVTDHGLTLSVARSNLTAASCGNYILAIGGGRGGAGNTNAIDIFQIFN